MRLTRPPFPGMDPWLEDPDFWPDFHNSLVVSIRDALTPLVIPRYFVRVESRMTVLTGEDFDQMYRPDVAVRTDDLTWPAREAGAAVIDAVEVEPYRVVVRLEEDEIEECFLTIRELPERKLVTAIEVLSPTNKRTKNARREYLDKRRDLMRSGVNLVEIDLLRSGQRMPLNNAPPPTDYRILVYRPRPNKLAEVFGFSYKDPIPSLSIPLLPGEAEPTLELNGIVHALIDRARYDLEIDYGKPPHPRLRKGDQAWAAAIVAQIPVQTPPVPAGGETAP
jgi:hypothetical protein